MIYWRTVLMLLRYTAYLLLREQYLKWRLRRVRP